MTEIPEHLLKRSRQARGSTTDEPADKAADPAPPAGSAGAPPAAEAPSAPEPEAPTPAAPVAPYNAAATDRPKIPWWAASALILLPIWAVTYVGTLERPPESSSAGLLAEGAHVYEARCAACHGAGGEGGSGPAMTDGEVLATFPTAAEHIVWVASGSTGVGLGNPYGDDAAGRVVAGGMPGFADALTTEELIGVVLYERAHLSHSEFDEGLAEAMDEAIYSGDLDLDGHLDPETVTVDEVLDLLRSASFGTDDQLANG
ncbi:MAG: hypothetical protein MAG471_01244 [Acidimicrobiaceae bacterium]|nr:hypothetical protein [Acidimicrobiaceae bacterium]